LRQLEQFGVKHLLDDPQSQQPDITTGAVLRFLESVKGRG
jgi:hypothetical protein